MRVNVVCRNFEDDRVLPRFARYLRDGLGWTLTKRPEPGHDVTYLMGYFEVQVCDTWPHGKVVSLFTHREEADPKKAALYDKVARSVDLRVAMCKLYAEPLSKIGPTVQPPIPVERDRFSIGAERHSARPVVGVSGFTYRTKRKGEDLLRKVVQSNTGRMVSWSATGRTHAGGWPVNGVRFRDWRDMPAWYQSLDVLLCPSRVEGGPLPVLEALSCGVPVVVPFGVGILDELPDLPGIYRYARGSAEKMEHALNVAALSRSCIGREALRDTTEPYTAAAWCEGNRIAVEALA